MINEKGPKYPGDKRGGGENNVNPEDVRKAFIEMMEKFIGPEDSKAVVAEVEASKNSLHTIQRPKSETGKEALVKQRLKELIRKHYNDYKIAREDDFIDGIIFKLKQEIGTNPYYNLDDTVLEGFTRSLINEVRKEKQQAVTKILETHKEDARRRSRSYKDNDKDDEE